MDGFALPVSEIGVNTPRPAALFCNDKADAFGARNKSMPISKNQRALLVVSNMVTHGRSDLKWLYQFIEFSGVTLAEMILRPHYETYRKLAGVQASKSAFVEALASLGSDDCVKAIDILFMLHGYEGVLCFEDGEVASLNLAEEIFSLSLKHKLRLLYSTTCYGKSHASDFTAAGFTTACGAVATNANAATEYPTVLTMWGSGSKFKDALAAGNNALTRIVQDKAAQATGFDDVNSDKAILGDGNITIDSIIQL